MKAWVGYLFILLLVSAHAQEHLVLLPPVVPFKKSVCLQIGLSIFCLIAATVLALIAAGFVTRADQTTENWLLIFMTTVLFTPFVIASLFFTFSFIANIIRDKQVEGALVKDGVWMFFCVYMSVAFIRVIVFLVDAKDLTPNIE